MWLSNLFYVMKSVGSMIDTASIHVTHVYSTAAVVHQQLAMKIDESLNATCNFIAIYTTNTHSPSNGKASCVVPSIFTWGIGISWWLPAVRCVFSEAPDIKPTTPKTQSLAGTAGLSTRSSATRSVPWMAECRGLRNEQQIDWLI